MNRILPLAALSAVFALCCTGPAFGSGDERTTTGDDLLIRTDTRWAGGTQGGYFPIRVQVTNHGPARDLTFELDPLGGQEGLRVRRVIGVDQNATVRFTLSVPIVLPRPCSLFVSEGGRRLQSHLRSFSPPGGNGDDPSPPSILVIAPTAADCGQFVQAANLLTKATPTPGYPGRFVIDASTLSETVQPTLLPDSWIDYSALDFVAISREELERLERPVRTALLKWVETGGNLIVYDIGRDAQAIPQLDRLIEAPDVGAATTAWQEAIPADRPKSMKRSASEEDPEGAVIGMPRAAGRGVAFARKKGAAAAAPAAKAPESPWRVGKDTFRRRDLMLGTVIAFADNPFPGSTDDWVWLLNSVGTERRSWSRRHGISPEMGSQDFYKFMNSGISGVPTFAFMVLITLFSIVIGPVNYVYLARKKMLWMLLVTVPLLAFTTSLILVGYSVAAHGIATRSRMRSLTVLDQRNHTSVNMGRLALFAGLTPSGGMRFSPETTVYPIYPPMVHLSGGTVDWTQTQNLVSGWLPARTRTQFYTVRNVEQRARVDFKSTAEGAEFANGLPWGLEAVIVADDTGKLHIAHSVPAGATARLTEPTQKELVEFVELLKRNPPEVPPNFAVPATPFATAVRVPARYAGASALARFDSNMMERRIELWQNKLTTKTGLAPRSYLAVLQQNPGIETGVPSTIDEAGLHLLNGYF